MSHAVSLIETTLPAPPWWLAPLDAAARRLRPISWGRGLLPSRAARELDRERLAELRRFLDCVDTPSLTFLGRRALGATVADSLARRRAMGLDGASPTSSVGEPPLFVVGFPRSGTTLLHSLLCLDPQARWLRPWELDLPFPVRDWGGAGDPRRRRHERRLPALRRRLADLDAIHPLDSPMECWQLLWTGGVSHTLFLFLGFAGYRGWVRDLTPATLDRAYEDYRRQLQYLQSRQPGGHWVLKAPEHAVNLAALAARFPEATIVQLHRNPLEVVPSLCSLAWHCQYLTVRGVTPRTLGPRVLEVLDHWQQAMLAARRGLEPGRVLDLRYRDLVARPIQTVATIYEHRRRSPPPAMREAMDHWLARRHRADRPRHDYDLAAFGLDRDQVEQTFQTYRDHFGVGVENT